MKALAGLAAIVIALTGCLLLTAPTTRAMHAELIESNGQPDDMPMYIHSDPDDWRG
jgi:hypothetical protein